MIMMVNRIDNHYFKLSFNMNIINQLTHFINKVFKTTLDVFFQALRMSSNAQGYVGGSITEILVMKELERHNLKVYRIREKWEGHKHKNHRGDFYFEYRKKWYVMEAKGIKSNSEIWHKLYNKKNLVDFLIKYSHLLPWVNNKYSVENQIEKWLKHNLPDFYNKYATNLYSFDEVKRYCTNGKKTNKAKIISKLKGMSQDEINKLINDRVQYIRSKIAILETHLVSGTSGDGPRKQATPRFDEFSLLVVDIYLRYPKHHFLFVDPNNLPPSEQDSHHLQQNYIIGFVIIDDNGDRRLLLDEEWTQNLKTALTMLDPKKSILEKDMQRDHRYLNEEGA